MSLSMTLYDPYCGSNHFIWELFSNYEELVNYLIAFTTDIEKCTIIVLLHFQMVALLIIFFVLFFFVLHSGTQRVKKGSEQSHQVTTGEHTVS